MFFFMFVGPQKSWKSMTISPGQAMATWQWMPSSCKVQHAMDAIRNARDRVTDEIRDNVHLDDSNIANIGISTMKV